MQLMHTCGSVYTGMLTEEIECVLRASERRRSLRASLTARASRSPTAWLPAVWAMPCSSNGEGRGGWRAERESGDLSVNAVI